VEGILNHHDFTMKELVYEVKSVGYEPTGNPSRLERHANDLLKECYGAHLSPCLQVDVAQYKQDFFVN
jgi:hypothetical protein